MAHAADETAKGGPKTTRDDLLKALRAAGQPAELIGSPSGAAIVVLPHGGRILGLFPAESDENFLWTNPALHDADTARAFFQSDQWHNAGGDRTWLAPEVDFFFPNFPDLKVYHQPRQLDPGRYECERVAAGVQLTNSLTLRASRTKQDLELRITKSIEPAANPLRHERKLAGLDGLKFAGYTLRCSLHLTGKAASPVGLWNLLQLPHGGEMIIPTYSRSEPKRCFGEVPGGDLVVEDRLIRYAMRAKGEQKIGVRAVATTGRAGYLWQSGRHGSLVIRNFAVDPSGAYVDVPWSEPGDLGYAFQACNIHGELGSFSELEHHAPAIGGSTDGPTRCEDVSQVWAFRGEADAVRAAARVLLSPAA
jgi:hypothetical protein